MKKQDSWSSQYRKNRFYKRQKEKRDKLERDKYFGQNSFLGPIPTEIAVMLDLDGTSNNIDDEKAAVFVKQLEFIRKKFKADSCKICISTHYDNPSRMKRVLDVLSRNLLENVKIGINFFYGGTYDYEDDKIEYPKEERRKSVFYSIHFFALDDCYIYEEETFNSDKVSTFSKYYLDEYSNNLWFAIIDDGIEESVYKKYKDTHPMLLSRPSRSNTDVALNNFMSIASTKPGMEGVIESLNIYIDSIKRLTPEHIFRKQQEMMVHLSSNEVIDKVKERNYIFLERYFKSGLADKDDYNDTLIWLYYTNVNNKPDREELKQIKRILDIISAEIKIETKLTSDLILKLRNIFDEKN